MAKQKKRCFDNLVDKLEDVFDDIGTKKITTQEAQKKIGAANAMLNAFKVKLHHAKLRKEKPNIKYLK